MCINILSFSFHIFENLIDIIIFLDILLSLIGALFKYLFLSCFSLLRYLLLAFFIITTTVYNIFYNNSFTLPKCCLENINKNIIKLNTSLCLTNNVFLSGQKETISVFSTTSISMTNYNPVIFYFIGKTLSSIFYKKNSFNITKQLFLFLTIFFFTLVVILSINQKIVI